MLKRSLALLVSFALLTLVFALPNSALADDPEPKPESSIDFCAEQDACSRSQVQLSRLARERENAARAHNSVPSAVMDHGGPDAFGYRWNDTEGFNWIDATSGIDTGLVGDSAGLISGAIKLPFKFPYYENHY